eukprot:1156469-Pelagomonas_calceolata.AAC.9
MSFVILASCGRRGGVEKRSCARKVRHTFDGENGRGTERINVLSPYVARLFAAMMEKAEIPTCWKAARLTPLHKKGSLLDLANDCMLAMAVSEPSNDVDCLAANIQGAVTSARDAQVTHMLYAGDLCLTANHPTELQIIMMLDRLNGYAQRKGLIISVSKSGVLHFTSKGNNVLTFTLGGAQLGCAESFNYLGMLLTST